MKDLQEINANEVTKMTWPMKVLFAVEKCHPTNCHACDTTIEVGEDFRLVTHLRVKPKDYDENRIRGRDKLLYKEPKDEMCCMNCGTKELEPRDRLEEKDWHVKVGGQGGFSRPSVQAKK